MNILLAIEALQKLAKENPNYEVAVVGIDGAIALEHIEPKEEEGEEFILLY